MAAPTNVRAEASSVSSAIIYWTYSGSNTLRLYRSTDGTTYTQVNPNIDPATVSHEDSGLSGGTLYYYKLSDDGGSTFSSAVTVTAHSCLTPSGNADAFNLPRFNGDAQQSSNLNDMASRIEAVMQGRVINPQACTTCPTAGAVVIDCSNGCHEFVVVADQDINSISIQMCNSGDNFIDFIIPPNTTRKICGWPSGFGFSGDECFRAPIRGGTAGRTLRVPFSGGAAGPVSSSAGYGGGISRGGAGFAGGGGLFGSDCVCVPGKQNQLTIKSCRANNSLDCANTKSLKLIACGGQQPYTWTKTGSVTLDKTTGTTVLVKPGTNNGASVSGEAYRKDYYYCAVCGASVCAASNQITVWDTDHYGCSDNLLNSGAPNCGDSFGSTLSVNYFTCCQVAPSCQLTGSPPNRNCSSGQCVEHLCDVRTAQMITDGCAPCGVVANGATVSVTDALGVVFTVILKS